jgi:hypothetical protein
MRAAHDESSAHGAGAAEYNAAIVQKFPKARRQDGGIVYD